MKKCLIFDPTRMCSVFVDLSKASSFGVRICTEIEDFSKCLEQEGCDVVVMEIKGKAFEVLQRIRTGYYDHTRQDTPVVVATEVLVLPEDHPHLFVSGQGKDRQFPFAFFEKPVLEEDITDEVRDFFKNN